MPSRSRTSLVWPAVLIAALAAACAKPPPPTVSMEGQACAAAPALADARPVPLEDKDIAVLLDPGAPCWRTGSDGPANVYAAFRLPIAAEPYILSVFSELRGQSLFAARILLLDDQGKTLREIGHDSFNFQGPSLRANLRARPDERYAIVASDPQLVGRDVSQVVSQVIQSGVVVRGAYVPIYTGADATRTLTFSYSGLIKVSARPLPAAN